MSKLTATKITTTKITSYLKNVFNQNNVYLIAGLLTVFLAIWTVMYLIPSVFIAIFNTLLGNVILILLVLLTGKYNVTAAIIMAIVFVVFYQFSHLIKREGFSIGSLDSSSITSAVSSTMSSQYANLAPLPLDNLWSQDTTDAYKTKYKELNPNATDQNINDTIVTYQKIASDDEAKSFSSTGVWPWDDFILQGVKSVLLTQMKALPINKDKSDDDIQASVDKLVASLHQNMPNRQMFYSSGFNFSPVSDTQQGKLFKQLKSDDGYSLGSDKYLKCDAFGALNLIQPSSAGPRTQYSMNADSEPEQYPGIDTHYSLLETLIPGFKFVSNSCNICDISKACAFSMNGSIPAPWDIVWGIPSTGASTTESTPSTVSSQQSADPSKFPELNKIKTELNQLFPSSSSSSSPSSSSSSFSS